MCQFRFGLLLNIRFAGLLFRHILVLYQKLVHGITVAMDAFVSSPDTSFLFDDEFLNQLSPLSSSTSHLVRLLHAFTLKVLILNLSESFESKRSIIFKDN